MLLAWDQCLSSRVGHYLAYPVHLSMQAQALALQGTASEADAKKSEQEETPGVRFNLPTLPRQENCAIMGWWNGMGDTTTSGTPHLSWRGLVRLPKKDEMVEARSFEFNAAHVSELKPPDHVALPHNGIAIPHILCSVQNR